MNPFLLFLNNLWEIREPPVRLENKQRVDDKHQKSINGAILILVIIMAMIIFLLLCVHIGGTESGVYYNGVKA